MTRPSAEIFPFNPPHALATTVLELVNDPHFIMFRSGMYLEEPKLPGRLGYEADVPN